MPVRQPDLLAAEQSGYKQVKIVKNKGYLVIATARYHFDWYQLLINRCSGKISSRSISVAGSGLYGHNGYGPNNGHGFNITLGF